MPIDPLASFYQQSSEYGAEAMPAALLPLRRPTAAGVVPDGQNVPELFEEFRSGGLRVLMSSVFENIHLSK